MSATGNAPRPWVKLWRDERGSFAQLPLYCRALAAEILKIADAGGRIELGGKAPHEAIAFALGADRSDRRLLAKHLPMLIADGYLEHADDALIVVGWARWQSPDPGTKQPRPRHEATTKRPRSDHEAEAKSPESHAPILQEGEGEGEVDQEGVVVDSYPEGAREPRPQPAGPPVVSTDFDRYRLALVRAFGRAFEERAGDMWAVSAHEQHIRTIVAWALDYRTRLPEAQRDPGRLMGRLVAGYFAAKTSKRPPVKWLAEDPGRYLERNQPRRESAPASEVVWGTVDRAPEHVTDVKPIADLDGLLSGLLRPLEAAERLHPMARAERSRESEEERRRTLARQAEALRASMETVE